MDKLRIAELAASSGEIHTAKYRLLGQCVELRTNSHIAHRWAELYLAPFCRLTDESPSFTVIALYQDGETRIELPHPDSDPVNAPLHCDKYGELWEEPDSSRLFVREKVQGDNYVLDRTSNTLLYLPMHETEDAQRDPARLVREALVNLAIGDGYLALHASCAVIGGRAMMFLGDKGSGKTTMLMHVLQRFGARYLSNDKVLVRARSDGSLGVHAVPLGVRIGVGTMRSVPALARHLHLFGHFRSAIANPESLWSMPDKLEFSPLELASMMNCKISDEAQVEELFFPAVSSSSALGIDALKGEELEQALRINLRTPDSSYPNWPEGDRTFKLHSDITSEPGRYVKYPGGAP